MISRPRTQRDERPRYVDLVNDAGWRRWTLATALSRLPLALAPLGLVLAGRYATGSFADGAILAGAYMFAESIAAPWQGRRLDRGDRRQGLVFALLGGSFGLAVLFVLILARAPLPVLIAVAVVAAALPSAVQSGFRAYLPELVDHSCTDLAFAFDAALIEVEWLSAPALVALMALLNAPYLVVAAMLIGTLVALAATRLLPPLNVGEAQIGSSSPWRNAAAARSYFVSIVLGYTEGTVTVALAPLLVTLHARAGLAGLVLVGLALASAAGGLIFGALSERLVGGREQQANAVMLALGLLAIPVALAPSVWAAVVAVVGFGLAVAPLNGLRAQLLVKAVPPAQRAEAFAILYAAIGAGFGGAGFAVGALLGPIGVRATIALAAAVAALSGIVMLSADASRAVGMRRARKRASRLSTRSAGRAVERRTLER